MPSRCLLEIECRIKAEKRQEFKLGVGPLLRSVGDGSSGAFVYEDQDDLGHMLCVEEWSSRSRLEEYLATDRYLALLGACQVLGTVLECRVVELCARHAATSKAAHSPKETKGWRILEADRP
jgi:quinol monooxygenase YgiN